PAYVDGELSKRERKELLKLLHRSSEARSVLAQFQENAHRVRRLTRVKPQPSMTPEVMQAIADREMQPTTPVRRVPRRRWGRYVAAAVAAAVIIVPIRAYVALEVI